MGICRRCGEPTTVTVDEDGVVNTASCRCSRRARTQREASTPSGGMAGYTPPTPMKTCGVCGKRFPAGEWQQHERACREQPRPPAPPPAFERCSVCWQQIPANDIVSHIAAHYGGQKRRPIKQAPPPPPRPSPPATQQILLPTRVTEGGVSYYVSTCPRCGQRLRSELMADHLRTLHPTAPQPHPPAAPPPAATPPPVVNGWTRCSACDSPLKAQNLDRHQAKCEKWKRQVAAQAQPRPPADQNVRPVAPTARPAPPNPSPPRPARPPARPPPQAQARRKPPAKQVRRADSASIPNSRLVSLDALTADRSSDASRDYAQRYREHGRFGSHPSHDGPGDED